jgi:predicted Zn finger-like uncharacterized protein
MQEIQCPECDTRLKVPEELAGKRVKCPKCATIFTASEELAIPFAEKAEPVETPSAQGDFDDLDEEELRPRRRRRRRRDLEPHRGTLVLVLGIVSFFFLPFVLGPIAWILGSTDLRAMREGRMDPEGESSTNGGKICGMISTILSLICCGGYGLVIMFGIMAGGFH